MTIAVILHWDTDGGFTWAAEKGAEVICIDERSSADRVYRGVGDMNAEVMSGTVARLSSGEFHDLVDALNSVEGAG